MLKTTKCLFGNNRLKWTKWTKLDQKDRSGLNWTEVDRIQHSGANRLKWTKRTEWTGPTRPKWT